MATEDITLKTNEEGQQQQVDQHTKAFLQSIMEAASALTRLGDEESGASAPPSPKREEEDTEETPETGTKAGKATKRFIPKHKKPDGALTFPEKVSGQ
jgi:general stress protein YciG